MMEFISQISLTDCTFQLFTKKCDEDYYKIEQIFYYNCDKNFPQNTSGFLLEKAGVLLQNTTNTTTYVPILSQNARDIIKSDLYYKMQGYKEKIVALFLFFHFLALLVFQCHWIQSAQLLCHVNTITSMIHYDFFKRGLIKEITLEL